jgi:L-lysine 6-transaminase
MAAPHLSKQQVEEIQPSQVHHVLGRTMLVDGFHIVVDLTRSEGNWLVDSITGKRYLDFFSYFASWAVGHNHPKMQAPKFMDKIATVALHNPSNSDVYSVEMAQFVATFERVLMPPEFKHVFFVSGGSLAVENALKCAFDWKVRKNLAAGKGERGSKVIHFTNSFHGRSGYTLSLTNTDPVKVMYFPKFDDWPRVDPPVCVFPMEGENLKKIEASEVASLAKVREVLQVQAVDVAAIIVETVQGEGGDNHFRKEFLQGLRQLADEFEVFLIFDEVQCGVGITGRTWAWQHFGVVPDAFSFGKKTQVCGFAATGRVDEVPDNVFHVASRINSTWGGNLTDMVRAQRILEIVEEDRLVENAAAVGAHFQKQLQALQARHPKLISNARGLGLLCAFDLPTGQLRNKVKNVALDKGLVILGCGSRSIRFRPALTTTVQEIDLCIKILEEVLTEMEAAAK